MKQFKINTGNYSLSFPSLFKKRVLEDGNFVAYIYKDIKYTWNDIALGSTIIEKELSNLGVKKGTHVGICGVNSINWIMTFYALQSLGAIVVLINPGLKANEVKNICEIGDVTYLCYAEIKGITTFETYQNVCLENAQIKTVFNFSDSIDFLSRDYDTVCINTNKYILEADDPCLMIYTSGSTGTPKAVLTSAYSIMYCLKPIIDDIGYNKKDINLAFLPFFHIFGFISSVVAPLLVGFTSIIPSNKSPKEQMELINKYKVTLFNTVPTMMLGIIQNKEFSTEKLASLRSTILGGAITTKEQMIMLRKLFPNNHFQNVYGMSENAFISITNYNDTFEHATETVGKPLEGIQVIIKDSEGNILPEGSVGEVNVKSGGNLIWYYKLSLNVQPIDESGFIKTGDLGFLDEDGYLHITGRIKDLIICGGENISPAEISDALLSLGYFNDVKVVGVPDEIKGEIVAAAVIMKPDVEWNLNKVNSELSETLAKYKLPAVYKVFTSFPLLSSGKVDKVAITKEIQDNNTSK